jgi:hypothetical protein
MYSLCGPQVGARAAGVESRNGTDRKYNLSIISRGFPFNGVRVRPHARTMSTCSFPMRCESPSPVSSWCTKGNMSSGSNTPVGACWEPSQVMDDSQPLFQIDHRPGVGIIVPQSQRFYMVGNPPSRTSPHPFLEDTVNPAEIFLKEHNLHESAAPLFYNIIPWYRREGSWVVEENSTDEPRATKRQRCSTQRPASDSWASRQKTVGRRLRTRGRSTPGLCVDTRLRRKPDRSSAQSAYNQSHRRSDLQRRSNCLSAYSNRPETRLELGNPSSSARVH